MRTQRSRVGRTAEVYTASLNDIMFFLLLFFLIISTMVTPATIRVLLPKSTTSQDVTVNKSINMIINAQGKYFIEKKEVALEEIEGILAGMKEGTTPEQAYTIMLQADKNLNLQKVVDIFDIAYKQGMKAVLYTQKEK